MASRSWNRSSRSSGMAVIAGAILTAVSAACHPIGSHSFDFGRAVVAVAAFGSWRTVHVFMGVGLVFWLVGLASCTALFSRSFHSSRVAISLFTASLAKWSMVLSLELATFPALARALVAGKGADALLPVTQAVFYAAGIAELLALALMMGGLVFLTSYLRDTCRDNFHPRTGRAAAWMGMAAIAASVMHVIPVVAAFMVLLLPTTWTILFGWRMARSDVDGRESRRG